MTECIFAKKRRKSLIDTSYLSNWVVYDNPQRLAQLRGIWHRVESDPAFSKAGRNSLGHTERYTDACRKVVHFSKLVQAVQLERRKPDLSLDEVYDLYLAVDENIPLDVHLSMFIPLMRYHTSAEQRARWLGPALKFHIIGAYAQTELAHGSNVRGIQTTATYKAPATEVDGDGCFEVHSPTLSALKWWPGGLGLTCTHAVVYAQLIIPSSKSDKKYGVHAFLVPLRDERTHQPLPGIECGDIGPKFGYNAMDNGYARFTKVLVPRFNMLAGFAQVARDGSYARQEGAEKVAYGIMLDVRVRIVANSGYVLARALTISLRYSFVRQQGGGGGESGKGEGEVSVIQYPTQQRMLLPLLSLAFGLHFIGQAMRSQYAAYAASAYPTGDDSSFVHEPAATAEQMLPMLHMRSACLKAMITQRVYDGMEVCRKACGGHGFTSNAGFTELMTSFLPMCTLEGTREVLGQQAGRSLLKMRAKGLSLSADMRVADSPRKHAAARGGSSGHMSVTASDLMSCVLLPTTATATSTSTSNPPLCPLPAAQLACFAEVLLLRVEYLIDIALNTVAAAASAEPISTMGKAHGKQAALLAAGTELVAASEAYAEYLVAQSFFQALQQLQCQRQKQPKIAGSAIDANTLIALQQMYQLMCMYFLEQGAGDAIASGVLHHSELTQLRHCVSRLCAALVDDSINLVEAWQISDTRLDSTLGRSDGKYMEALYEAAKAEPLNTDAAKNGGVSLGYSKYLRELLQGGGQAPGSGFPVAVAKL